MPDSWPDTAPECTSNGSDCMAQLSSHPLPPSALRAAALRQIYENTPRPPSVRPIRAEAPDSGRASVLGVPRHSPDESGARPRVPLEQGRFQILEYLDSGGTADVFAAVDCTTGQRVAIKVLNAKSAADPLLRRYFLEGSRGALGIEHPNLLRIYAVEEPAEAVPFAVMELVRGRPLSSILHERGPLRPEQVVQLSIQAAAGLDAAHRCGLVHCDVKPENLLVEEDANGELRLKVIDFDLASTGPEEDSHEHPMLRGTAKYMAPEQVVSDPVDARTDVYALGVVMFRMLTGHLPFDLELSATLLWHQLASPLPPVSWLCDEVDPALEAVIQKASRKAPDNRYASMSLLLADLHGREVDAPLLAMRPLSEPDTYLPRKARALEYANAIRRSVA